jgi:ferritin-like metal-binding protein YciE
MAGDKARDLLVIGLRNAHAMESQAEELMERQVECTSDLPEVQSRLQQHLDETRMQLRRLEECLEACGESPSTIKDTALSALGNLIATGHVTEGDEILKNTFANNAFEHYEIAAYKSLLAMCEEAGIDLSELLRASLREEEAMAEWIDGHVAEVTRQYMAMEEPQPA